MTRRTTRNKWLSLGGLWLGGLSWLCGAQQVDAVSQGGIQLREFAKQAGFHHQVLQEGEGKQQVEQVSARARGAVFQGEAAHFLVNGIKVDLPQKVGALPKGDKTSILIQPDWWKDYIAPLLDGDPLLNMETPIVFLDPGHGGKHPGTANAKLGLVEKDLNLDIALRLKKLLEESGWKVVLSREKDTDISLEERTVRANRSGAHLFLSIHFNSASNVEAQGIETYVLIPKSATTDKQADASAAVPSGSRYNAQNLKLAWSLQNSLIQRTQWRDRGVRRANFVVLRELKMPGVLVELGFLSNQQESDQIASETVRQQLAKALQEGLLSLR